MIKRMIAGTEETKYVANRPKNGVGDQLDNAWRINANATDDGDFYPALPVTETGDDDHQRTGSQIQPTGLRVKLNFYFNQDLSGNQIVGTPPGQFIVTIFYGTSKAKKTWENETPIASPAYLLDNGDGTTSAYAGNLLQLNHPINKKSYTAKRMTFKLGKAAGVLSGEAAQGLNQDLVNGGFSTSGGQSFKSVTLRFKPPKNLHYEDKDAEFPNNYAPWFVAVATPVNRLATPYTNENDASKPPITVTSECQMWYKDA